MKYLVILMAVIIIIVSNVWASGINYTTESPEIIKALEKAGENRSELEKVIDHYKADANPQKLMATLFLIGNMEEHCYVTYRFVDTAQQEIFFEAMSFPSYDSLQKAARAIEKERGEWDYEKKDKVYDLEVITADFLISHIDYAFKAWAERPWAVSFDFDQFCNYILPYRGSNEPLEDWRTPCFERFADISQKVKTPTDPEEAARMINSGVGEIVKFDERFYYHPTDQGYSEMIESKLGRCEDITNFTIFALRANGLAITSDYTPYWADFGNNHAWSSIVRADGKVIPFEGEEIAEGEYRLFHKFAKIYRKMFAQQRENLVFQDNLQEEIPRWLAGKNFKDVTSAYTKTISIPLLLEKEIPDSVDIAYLCVFNSGYWKPIDWARIENGAVKFNNIAAGVAVLPALYLNEEIEPYGFPLIGQKDTAHHQLKANKDQLVSMDLIATAREKIKKDEPKDSYLKNGEEYELFYYDFGWQSLGKQVAGDKPMRFEKVPHNAIYWLVASDTDHEERIFTYENNSQVWW